MIMDKRTEFADAVSVVGTAGTTINVGSQIDLSVARDIGAGQPLYLVINVDTDIITGGAAGTIAFQLVSDSTDSIATNGTQSIHFVTKAFVTDDAALNELDSGEVAAVIALPMEGVAYERYLGVQAVIGTTDTTAGKINAFLTHDVAKWKAYADAVN
jgi:hypothetical protein